jgi:hypothetical protein
MDLDTGIEIYEMGRTLMRTRMNPLMVAAFCILAAPIQVKADVKNIALGVNEAT